MDTTKPQPHSTMDKFPVRRQGNQWGGRHGSNSNNNNALRTSSFSTGGRTTGVTGGMDSVSLPDRAAVLGVGEAGAGAGGGGGKAAGSEADRLFKLKLVERSAEQVLAERLRDVQYDCNTCRDMSPEVASAIVQRLRQFCLQQYKLVCVLSLGSLKERPGVQFGSRCLWNKDTDNFVSVKYSNGSVYAVALIFGLYFESSD